MKFWFALETIVGAESNEKVPNLIRDRLADLYAIDVYEAGNRFGFGAIYGVRKRIVHQGARIEE